MNLTPQDIQDASAAQKGAALAGDRRQARDAFGRAGWPATTAELFRSAKLDRLYRHKWTLGSSSAAAKIAIGDFLPPTLQALPRLVFVDGAYDAAASIPAADAALALSPLSSNPSIAGAFPLRPEGYANAFLDLNTALFAEGALVHQKKGASGRVVLLSISTDASKDALRALKHLVAVDDGAELAVIEIHAGRTAVPYWSNAFTHARVGANARLDHTRVQVEGPGAFHIGGFSSEQGRDSRVRSFSANFGAGVSRVDVAAAMRESGAHCDVNGVYYATGEQSLDQYTLIDHAQGHCTSGELFKGVLDGKSATAFTGKIVVRPDAQKTDSRQLNRNLILSKEALADSLPQLEIFANDVKCSHGSTIGELDDNEVFYLRSRGLTAEQAKRELIRAYALEAIELEPDAAVRAYLEGKVLERLEVR